MKNEIIDYDKLNLDELIKLKEFLTAFSSLSMYKRLKILSKLNLIIEHKRDDEYE